MIQNGGDIVPATVDVGEILAYSRVHQTTLDVVPVSLVDDIVLQQCGELRNSVLRRNLALAAISDDEREDGEEDEQHDDEERDDEVGVEGDIDAAERAHDSKHGDDEDEEAAEQERVLQHLLAVGAVGAVEVDVGGAAHGGEGDE